MHLTHSHFDRRNNEGPLQRRSDNQLFGNSQSRMWMIPGWQHRLRYLCSSSYCQHLYFCPFFFFFSFFLSQVERYFRFLWPSRPKNFHVALERRSGGGGLLQRGEIYKFLFKTINWSSLISDVAPNPSRWVRDWERARLISLHTHTHTTFLIVAYLHMYCA